MAAIESEDQTVFVETNLNTHFAVAFTDNDAVGHLKEKISSVHLNCFPVLGKINVRAIKVKRKKHFYHLSDSILVKIVFERVKGTRFLYVDAAGEKSEDRIAHDPIGESMKEIDHGENQLHTKQAVLPENLSVEKPLVNNEHVTSAGLAVKPVKKKNPASIQQVQATVDAVGEKSEDRIVHDPVGESMKEIDHGENQLHAKQAVLQENLSVEKPLVDNERVTSAGLAVKPVKKKKKKKNPASIQQVQATVDAVEEKSEARIAHDPIGESMKEIDHGENQLHAKQAVLPENLSVEKPLVDNEHITSAGLAVKPVKKKKNPASIQQVKATAAPSDLKRKLPEAYPDTEAKDVSNTRVKKKRSIKIFDGETGLLNSGAGEDVSTSDVVPVTSKSEKTLVAEHPILETKKAGKSLPPTGKPKKLKVKTIVVSSSCLEKGSNKDCGIGDNSVNMVESSKTKQSSSQTEKQGCTPL